jgi:hypothetical protein
MNKWNRATIAAAIVAALFVALTTARADTATFAIPLAGSYGEFDFALDGIVGSPTWTSMNLNSPWPGQTGPASLSLSFAPYDDMGGFEPYMIETVGGVTGAVYGSFQFELAPYTLPSSAFNSQTVLTGLPVTFSGELTAYSCAAAEYCYPNLDGWDPGSGSGTEQFTGSGTAELYYTGPDITEADFQLSNVTDSVPEPGSFALVAMGLAAFAAFLWRHRAALRA